MMLTLLINNHKLRHGYIIKVFRHSIKIKLAQKFWKFNSLYSQWVPIYLQHGGVVSCSFWWRHFIP